MTFFQAWWWLYNHPINLRPNSRGKLYNAGMYQLDIWANTKTSEIFLEFGPFPTHDEYLEDGMDDRKHDPELDVAANTFEEAIMNLAVKVKQLYGNYDNE